MNNLLIIKHLHLILPSVLMLTKYFRGFFQFSESIEWPKMERLFCVQIFIKKSLGLLVYTIFKLETEKSPPGNEELLAYLWLLRWLCFTCFLTSPAPSLKTQDLFQMESCFTHFEIAKAAYPYTIKSTQNMCHSITLMQIQNK